ncbi:MAG: 50S ribosomal protein L19 [bacterium ADurb.Bin157]|jgi:large subunit ribosomal protein L19|nr:50S ribosomal protein L19 [Candidatus Riflebacteria bacterium]MDD2623638.1 50S ribosomal protein L19 [Candidatus Riflebacteria bacterium]MDD3376027.1 50S ribosomal protein L19 [Candidatus Riflebacteria bacterium]NCB45834.1 50S ribosomal protein L19 [bacterium]OQB49080.1 MAG: 50S ribosomal protein L19 [bacterium ADurb.Bin157]
MNPVIESVERNYQKNKQDFPNFFPGDTVRLEIKVREGEKERLQAFEGVVIARRHNGLRENFTVRKISYGVGVERTFMFHSPSIAAITLLRSGKVARGKLYYLRDRVGKKTRVKDKIYSKDKA